ncbi:MAG: NAD(P)/FAD-dependent oxidoreductase [Clostridiales bacterium]|jgi:glycerol-3-phosphate dehydrogenase|nr:NAD(P)/FAD-dependent oxidoreductase [Clostridiales bacterium]
MIIYDCLIIGGGVIGTAVLYELSHYDLSCALLEKENDVSIACTARNSGIVHAGYDCKPGTFKARFNVRGNRLFEKLCFDLGVPYKKTGSLVVGGAESLGDIRELHERGRLNGVYTEILDRDGILKLEPNVSDEATYALYAPDAGVVTPFKLAIAYADNATVNGARIFLNCEVNTIEYENNYYKAITADGRIFYSKILINAAGYAAGRINALAKAEELRLSYGLGEYFLLDKRERAHINTILFPLPDYRGKGILVAPTAEDNVLYGPTSTPVSDPEDYVVTAEGLETIKNSIGRIYKRPNFKNVIRTFSGIRSSLGEDFVVERSELAKNYITIAGICSPGLTAAPAIAEYVVTELIGEMTGGLKNKDHISHKEKFAENYRKIEALNERIRQNHAYGRIVCRCETVSEGEILEAIHSPLPATTVDAVKRRVRTGMGRCQGGFCAP